MDTEQLKKNFEEQLATTDKQIAELEENLAKAKEYRLKLQGGLETLALLEPKEETEVSETEVVEGYYKYIPISLSDKYR